MSTKSHTKNELARISAKIQQLKKKYPTSSELYIPTEKQNIIAKTSLNDDPQQYNSNSQLINKNPVKERLSNNNSRNSPKQNSCENTDRSSKNQPTFVHTQFNPNGRFYEERKYHQSCNKKSVFNKQNVFPFSQDLNHQKPFKEYKEELKNLKKEILSSLDFQNFQLSKQRTQNTPKIINNTFETFSKNPSFNLINNSFVLNSSKPQQVQAKENETQSTKLVKNQNIVIKIVEQSQNSMVTEQQKSVNQINLQHDQVKNYESHLSLEYLNEILQKLHENFHLQKQQVSQKLQKFDSESDHIAKQNSQINQRIQKIEKQMKKKEQLKASEFDMKIVEIQNQSIGKLSKQVHKELELINAEINAIKAHCFDNEKSQESQSIEFSKQIVESFTYNLKQEMIEKLQLTNERYQNHLKDMESKFFRQIFDMKNQIQLMGEKIKKQDYFERTLKTLVPQSSRNNETKTQELTAKIRKQLLIDSTFLSELKQAISSEIFLKIGPNIETEVNRVQSEVSEQILKEISIVNKNLKEFETKMISYGILIENVEENLKELSNSQNDQQIEIALINRIKEAVIIEIDSELGCKLYPLNQSVLKQRDSKAFLKEQQVPYTNEEIQSESAEVQICPIVNERNYVSNGTSQVSIFTREGNSDIWLTGVDDQSVKKMFNSEVKLYERPSYASEKGPSSLLDQLVQNSLIFNALNH